jgi:hypothetical protein
MVRQAFRSGDRTMVRLFAAALLLSVIAVPAFACEYNKSAETDGKTSTVASQPASDQSGQARKDKAS